MLNFTPPTLAYFKNEDQALFLARIEPDGWHHLGRYPLAPLIRDPFVSRGWDGRWHLLFTEAWDSQRIGHCTSDDLRSWDVPDFPLVLPNAKNCWAPEFVADASGDFWHWSSTRGDHQAIWARRTGGEPFLLFDPGYPVIDSTIHRRNGRWEMAFKDEREGHKAIRVAYADDLEGPYGEATDLLTPPETEGPIFWGDGIVYDSYRANRWGTTGKALPAPPDARHGSIVR